MRYFEGDIVEIITSDYRNKSDAKAEGWPYNRPVPFIGQRFRVRYAGTDEFGGIVFSKPQGDLCSRDTLQAEFDNVRLYRRPFRNWLKLIFTRNESKIYN